jgi:hypothetical protein
VLVNSATGRFEALDVVPGKYLLRATQTVAGKAVRGEREVQVGNADLQGIVVDLVPGVTVKGTVRVQGSTPQAELSISPFRRHAGMASVELEREGVQSLPPALMSENGEFSFEDVAPGRYHVAVQPFTGYVASIVAGTQDLMHQDLVIAPGVAPPAIEIDVHAGGGGLTGTLEAGEGAVLVAPAGAGEVRLYPAFTKVFTVGNLAPGKYTLFWVKDVNKLEYRNPEALRALRGGVTVDVTDGATAQVALKEMAQ